jgi:leader peptidase (prepilin peptidase)/N-methyltransferase
MMTLIPILLYAGLGWLVGGGLNALADDLPGHRRVQRWRCLECQAPRWPLAVAAYLAGRGKCGQCSRPIGWRAVLVEFFTALVFAFLWQRYGLSLQLALVSFYLAVYILVTVTDLEHRLILDAVTYPAIAVAVIAAFFNTDFKPLGAFLGGLLAFAVLLAMYGLGALFGRVRGRPGVVPFGQGDVKLGAFIGLTTGPAVVFALSIGILAAGLVALGYVIYFLVVLRRSALGVAMPYGPFLALGGALMTIWGPAVVAYYTV